MRGAGTIGKWESSGNTEMKHAARSESWYQLYLLIYTCRIKPEEMLPETAGVSDIL